MTKATKHTQRRDYAQHKQRAAQRSAARSQSGRDIGDIPPVVDHKRRKDAEQSLQALCEIYFSYKFTLKWSNDHLKAIKKIERCVLENLQFAFSMPRGSGKTTLCECAVIWALLKGIHPFIFFIGAAGDEALSRLETVKTELSTNELLLADFPEIIYPIRCLDGEARRCAGQHHHGIRTQISWSSDQIVIPTIPGSRASGTIIRVAGITGNIRGAKHTRADGSEVRPSLVILDDPQTDESARSASQCASRLSTINGAIRGLAGPGKTTAIAVPCTVIEENDVADQLLDREKNPQWFGERMKLVYKFPKDTKLWDEYAQIRRRSLIERGDISQATNFYKKNRKKMDKGAKIQWPDRYLTGEISALQHAMNLKLADPYSFAAEYQNQPKRAGAGNSDIFTAKQIVSKTNGTPRGQVPTGLDHLTCFIDVQKSSLWWTICGFGEGFTCAIIDYGVWPKQDKQYFTLKDVKPTLQDDSTGGLEAAIYNGLEKCSENLLGKEYRRVDETMLRIERCLIDANWGESTDTVYLFARQSKHAAIVMPAHGRFIGASSNPMSMWPKRPGDQFGHHWRIRTGQNRAVRHIVFDANLWKSHIQSRWATPLGDSGSLSLCDGSQAEHQMIAEHLTSEYRIKVTGRNREVDEWKLRPARDNHWLDGLVGCAVAASTLGVAAAGHESVKKPARRKPTQRPKVTF